MRVILLCILLGVYTCTLAQEGKKQTTRYVYADTVAFYDKPDARATPVGYYYFGDILVGVKSTGLLATLPLLAAHQCDQGYWSGEMYPQSNELTGEWFEKNVNGNRVYIPGQGISTIHPIPSFDDEPEYLIPEERIKRWLSGYVGNPIDSIHTFLPKVSEDDIHEKHQLIYTNHVELSVEEEYDSEGPGGAIISMYLPNVKLTEGYWLAIRLYLGELYTAVKWIKVRATDNSIVVSSFSEGQTLEITAMKEKEGVRLIWLYGGC